MVTARPWVRWSLRADRGAWVRLFLRVFGVAFVAFVVMTVAAVEVTEQPIFCKSCHIMEPYYASWASSSHKDVSCIDCHYEPGIRSTIRGKFQGIRQVVVYFTGGAGTRPWAEIEDASCLRSGCHETRLLEGKIEFHGVHFDHKPHLTETRRGKKLRCTTCHSQIVQGSHVTVTTAACVLCHFKGQPAGKPIGGCRGCHDVPSDSITLPGGVAYNHKTYLDRGVDCVSCHATLTAGDGFVPKARCYVCHNIPIDTYLVEPEFLHQKHVTEHKVECTDCHEEMTHGYESERRQAHLDCNGCHEGMHRSTVALAEGAGRFTNDSRPHVGPMLAARVECISCHVKEVNSDTPHAGSIRIGSSEACVTCHGPAGGRVLNRWDEFFRIRIPEVEAAIRASRAPRSFLVRARDLLETVRVGRPVHNPALARDLLDAAERLARGESGPIQRPIAERREAAGLDCSYCHLEGPRGAVQFQGARFLHRPHTRDLGIDCALCHEGAPASFPQGRHGQVRIAKADCQACHHRQVERCAGCHGAGPTATIPWNGRNFPHARHAAGGVPCATCHTGGSGQGRMGVSIDRAKCESCHHAAERAANCATCHGEGPEQPVARAGLLQPFPHRIHAPLGLGCGDCHTAGSPERMIDPLPCATCHEGSEGGPPPLPAAPAPDTPVAPAPAPVPAPAAEAAP